MFWVLKWSQEKLKTMLTQTFGGQPRCIVGVVQMANCKTSERNFCVTYETPVISELTQRTAKHLCVTNMIGYYLRKTTKFAVFFLVRRLNLNLNLNLKSLF